MTLQAQFNLRYPEFALQVDLQLPASGITGIFGRSGSGKTSLLRCVAGLEQAEGKLTVNDEVWQDQHSFVPTHRRPLAYVFQEASLFSHLSVRGNLDYARKRGTANRPAISYDDAIALFNIQHLLRRYPHQLSGGEKQRAAIVRALLINPRLLLMDEPLAALDLKHKQEILPYLEKLHHRLSIPVLYVSHSADEITRLADHLVILENGGAIASGPLQETLSRLDLPVPLGEDTGVVLEAKVVERDQRWQLARVTLNGGEESDGDIWLRDGGEAIGDNVRLRILARDVSLARENHADTSIVNRLPATIVEIAADSDDAMVLTRLEIGASILLARVTKRSQDYLDLKVGEKIWAQIKSVAIVR